MLQTGTPFPAENLPIKTSFILKISLLSTLLFIFLIPWGNVIWDGFTRIFGIVALGFGALALITHGTHKKYSFFHLFILLFGTWLVFSVIWTPDIAAGKSSAMTIIQLVLISFLISLIINSKDKFLLAYQSYVLGACIGSSIILYNYLNGIQYGNDDRYSLLNFEVDGVSIILALTIPMAAYLTTQYQNIFLKIINSIAIPLCILGIFLTGTRTASIAAIVGVGYWLFTHRKAKLLTKFIILSFFVGSTIGVFTFAPKDSVDRIFSSGKSISSGTLNYRTVIWGASLNKWKESPIIGSGIGGLAYVLSPSHVQYGSAHNTFVQILTETGIVGLIFYLLLIGSIVFYILRNPINEKAFLLSLLLTALLCQLTMNTMKDKETWFVLTMLAIHAHYMSIGLKRFIQRTHVI